MNLPKVYQNNNIDLDNHDQIVYYSRNNQISNPSYSVKDKIANIFNKKSYIYKINVEISDNNRTYSTTIIGKTDGYLITINNELIPIKNIKDIKKLD